MFEKPAFLTCDPAHFSVRYAINPWMKGNLGRTSAEETRRQWDGLLAAIRAAGGEVHTIPQHPDLPDQVFTANVAVILGRRAVLSRFAHPQRVAETEHAGEWLAEQGFDVTPLPEGMELEGTGDLLRDFAQPLFWAGYGHRTSLEAHTFLARELGYEIVTLRLVNPRFYHLDVCLCPLPGGHVMYYPGAFDVESLQRIEERIGPELRIPMSETDALNLACNAVPVGDAVILHQASEALRGRLAQTGYRVVETDLSQFMLSGGSARCLVLPLNEPRLEPCGGATSVCERELNLQGHLLDFSVLARCLDHIAERGCSFEVRDFRPGRRPRDLSRVRLMLIAPSRTLLEDTALGVTALCERSAALEIPAS